MGSTWEATHVNTNLCKNHFCTSSGDAGNFVYRFNCRFIFRHVSLNQLIQFTDPAVQIVDMIDDLCQQLPLQRCSNSVD